jgi:hypothetical protein
MDLIILAIFAIAFMMITSFCLLTIIYILDDRQKMLVKTKVNSLITEIKSMDDHHTFIVNKELQMANARARARAANLLRRPPRENAPPYIFSRTKKWNSEN